MRLKALALLMAISVCGIAEIQAAPEDVTVTGYELVSSQRVGRTINEYVLRIEIDNAGGPLTNVIGATVASVSATSVVEGEILIGDLAAGAATPEDTITVRHNRRYRFSPTNLVVTFTGDEIVVGDNAPVILSSPSVTGSVGATYNYDVEAIDADPNDELTYSLQLAPLGMSIDAESGLIDWQPTAVGTYDVDLVVTDSTGLSDRQIFLVRVGGGDNDGPPAIGQIPDQVVVAGSTLEVTATGIDPEGQTVRYGIVEAPEGVALNGFTGLVSWTPGTDQLGDFPVTISVTDPGGQIATTQFTVSVLSEQINNAPVIDAVPDQFVNAFETISLSLNATDADENDILRYSLDGAPVGVSFNAASGLLSWAPGTDDVGVTSLVATVADSAGDTSSTSFSITVAEPASAPVAVDDAYTISERAVLNVPAPGVLSNDLDPNNDALSASTTTTTTLGTLDVFDADGSFQYTPPAIPPIQVGFATQCETQAVVHSDSRNVAVADVDADGDLEFVNAVAEGVFSTRAYVYDAATCAFESSALWRRADGASYGEIQSGAGVTLVNLDDDPELEIVAAYARGNTLIPDNPAGGRARLIAMNLDGTPVWGDTGVSEPLTDPNILTREYASLSPSAVDLDGDGTVELVVAFYYPGAGSMAVAYEGASGAVRWEVEGRTAIFVPPSPRTWTIADIDLDGTIEILLGNSIFSHDGAVEFNFPDEITSYMEVAVGNFDADPFAEIIAVNRGGHRLFEHTGELVWLQPRTLGHHGGITIAELDGDAGPEYLIQQSSIGENRHLAAFDGDGVQLWSHLNTEFELDVFNLVRTTTPIAFDFDRDGVDELVSQIGITTDGRQDRGTYVFDGSDGSVVANAPASPGALNGFNGIVTIADVDADNAAEVMQIIRVGINANRIRVLEGLPGNPFPPARPIRNQWLYHPTQVAEDGSIPVSINPQWLIPGLNKQNVSAVVPGESEAASDMFQYIVSDGSADSNVATVAIEIATVNAPNIISTPQTGASPGFDYEYPALATDADFGDVLTWTLVSAPSGMNVDQFGLVRWVPEASDLGLVSVSLVVTDTDGNSDTQLFDIDVQPPVTVPDVITDNEVDAAAAIDAAGAVVGRVSMNYSLTAPPGSVIEQSVAGGEEAAAGAFIDLVISLGPPPIFAPELVSLSTATATAELEALGLALGTVETANSDSVPRGLILSQTTAPGTQLAVGDVVDVVVSGGPALRVGVNSRFVAAGSNVNLSISAFDSSGNAVPAPPFNATVTATDGATGVAPNVAGLAVETSEDTRGVFEIEVDVPGFGVAEVDLVVLEQLDTDAYLAPVANFAGLLDELAIVYENLSAALGVNDLNAVQTAAQQLASLRTDVEVDLIATRNPFVTESGFLPSVAEASQAGFAPGFTPLNNGAEVMRQLSAALADVSSYVDLLDPNRGRNDDLRGRVLNSTLENRVDALLALDLPVGTQLALNGSTFGLLAEQMPRVVVQDMDLLLNLLVQNGLVSVESQTDYQIAQGPAALFLDTRPTFFTLAGMASAASIRSNLWKKLYMPYVKRLVSASLVLQNADLIRETQAPIDLTAIITGASQSFHIFGARGSIIEGIDFTRERSAFRVRVVGPDRFQGVVDVLAGGTPPRSLGDFIRLGNEVRNAASQGDAAGNRDGRVNAILEGCFFDQNPGCAQLVLGGGFPSVHSQGSFPAPVLIIVEDLATGQFYSGVYPFFPSS